MEISRHTAKLLKELSEGERISFSRLSNDFFSQLIEERILLVQIQGRTRKSIYLPNPERLEAYLQNHYNISNLDNYIAHLETSNSNRTENIKISGNSKLKKVRTFKGFMVNVLSPITVMLNGKEQILLPNPGSFTFIYDYQSFSIPDHVTVIGIENTENFRYIEKQQELFSKYTPLFVCRYPQSQHKDLIQWLQSIPNPYLHFGDFDFAGITIYQNEYKKYLNERASLFFPLVIEELLPCFGNRNLYDKQLHLTNQIIPNEPNVAKLLQLIHLHHKGLEQEILIDTV
nr:hypothetical protein [uncultured Bacteroides sp.]